MAETAGEQSSETVAEPKRHRLLVDLFIRLVKEKQIGVVGLVIVMVLAFTAIFAELLAPYGWNEFILADRLAPPSPQYLLGTDNLGRDLLSRIIFGARISIFVAFGAATLSTTGSAIIGVTSGYFGGKFDILLQRWVDAWQAFPALVLYLTVMAILGPGLTQVVLVLGIHGAVGGGRVFRSWTMAIKENAYIEAARSIGAPNRRIIMRHVLPQIFPIVLINYSVGLGRFILVEASLSFLGFGIPPPFPSWGGMISGSGRTYMLQAPWMLFYPGFALFVVVYGANMLGDAIRDLLDPRLRGGLGRYGGMSQQKLAKLAEKKQAKS